MALKRTKSTQSQLKKTPLERKRSLAAKKGAVTRALNREASGRQKLLLRHKLTGGILIAIVLVFAGLGIRSEIGTFAASTATGTIKGIGGKCLDNYLNRAATNNRVNLWRCNGTTAQSWTITTTGAIQSSSGSGNYCVDVPGNSKSENTYVRLYKCNNSPAQQFVLSNNTIRSKTTGFCLTDHFGSTGNGTKLWMKKCSVTISAAQKWTYNANRNGTGAGTGTTTGTGSGTGTGTGSGTSTGTGAGTGTGNGSGSGTGSGTSTGGGSTSTGSNGVTYGTVTHPFAANSPWNTPLPSNPAIDPNSSAIVSNVLNSNSLIFNMILYGYGQPTYVATASTPKVTFGGQGGSVTFPFQSSWGSNSGADAKINVIDGASQNEWEFDGFNGSAKTAYWWVEHNYVTGLADGFPTGNERRGPTGSGISQLAGMIRISDINSGSIDHALSFITSQPMVGEVRYPASQTDGKRTAANGVAEGMRIQLDPSLNLDNLGMSAGEKMVAKALQKYGAYCTDNGGNNNMAAGFYAEKPTTTADPYPGVGFTQDWQPLRKIPRGSIRVMAASVTTHP